MPLRPLSTSGQLDRFPGDEKAARTHIIGADLQRLIERRCKPVNKFGRHVATKRLLLDTGPQNSCSDSLWCGDRRW